MSISINPGRWFRWNSAGIGQGSQFQNVGNVEMFARDGFIGPLTPSTSYLTASGAVAIGASLALGNVTAGKMPLFNSIIICATVAGGYWFRYNAVAIAQIYLGVNQPFQLIGNGKGLLLTTKGAAVDILNNTGAAVAIAAAVFFSEHSG